MAAPEGTDDYIISTDLNFYDDHTEDDEILDEQRCKRGLRPLWPRPDWFIPVHCKATSKYNHRQVVGECQAVFIDLREAKEEVDSIKGEEEEEYVDLLELLIDANLGRGERYLIHGLVGSYHGILTDHGEMQARWCDAEYPDTRGTGVWGVELSEMKNVLLISLLHVEPDWRGEGIGTKMVRDIIQKTCERYCHDYKDPEAGLYAFTWPGSLLREDRRIWAHVDRFKVPVRDLVLRMAERFWRDQGFRRVGKSSCFGYTTDANHPSRSLTTADDEAIDHDLKEFGVRPPWQPVVPAHMAELVRDLGKPHKTDQHSTELLKGQMPDDPTHEDWGVRAEFGNTLLHLAALSSKPEAIRFILARQPGLAAVENMGGRTPLRALERRLALEREREPTHDLVFKGFPENTIESWCLLSQVPYVDLDCLSEGPEEDSEPVQQLQKLKYGCSCESCLGGWFSKRSQLIMTYAAMDLHSSRVKAWDDMGFTRWYDVFIKGSRFERHITNEETPENEAAAMWIVELFQHFESCIGGTDERPPKIPTLENMMVIIQEAQGETPQPGDETWREKVLFAAAMVLIYTATEDWESLGDGFKAKKAGKDEFEMEELREEVDDLPECANDGYYRPLLYLW
ncbi:hypothetical protein QBC41DRAFT_397104 [Cercophora samala]|uniref:N-acetyltransferase domain-containing protein n=1 Tax=Cercophora samala TaxID=330535 RepID=A0AA39ZLM7_9PEZI|nr:hypothetical protein QBC41DRAFT_397104 [Cercophora samala]